MEQAQIYFVLFLLIHKPPLGRAYSITLVMGIVSIQRIWIIYINPTFVFIIVNNHKKIGVLNMSNISLFIDIIY